MAKPTIDDVAKLAGVSIKTVSRVVNREKNVAEATRDKVEAAIRTLGYQPSKSARNLASQRSHLIGLVYDDPARYEIPSAGYVMRLQQGALAVCKRYDFDLLIHPCAYRERGIGREIRNLIEHARPDGLLFAAPLSDRRAILRAAADAGVPYMRISPGGEREDPFSVRTNDRGACVEMTRYLVSLGHERIAFVRGHPDHKAVVRRYRGFADGLRECGLALDEDLVVQGDNSIASGEACARDLLGRREPPTAIFAANDDMAAGILRVALQLGIRVPGQLSVAGFDDIALAQQVFPSMTTIRQPLARLAENAAEALLRGLRNEETAEIARTVPAELVVRDSTGPAPSPGSTR